MKKYKITNDGFGVHTFALTKKGISSDEYERIVKGAKSKYFIDDKGSVFIYPSRRGVRIFINCVNPNLYNIKVIVSAKRLIDEGASATSILNMYDDFDLLHELVNAALLECLGEEYTLNTMCLSRIDLCVNVMLSESFSAERYIKLIRKSMIRIDDDKIKTYADSPEKNRHSFRVETGNFTFTAYDKYYQLEDIDESYEKESEGLLRLEIAINRRELHSEQIFHNYNNFKLLKSCTKHSKSLFQKYIEEHFFDGDYYSIDGMRGAIDFSDYSKSQKGNMLFYVDLQCYKHSFNSILDSLVERHWTENRLLRLFDKFERINVYPVSMAHRDKRGDKCVPGLRRILEI